MEGATADTQPYFSLRQDTTGAKDLDPVLPGHGEVGEGCGKAIKLNCLICGHTFEAERSCLRRECPNCYEGWAGKEARFASWRVWTGAKRRCHDRLWAWRECRMLHVVISIPDEGRSMLRTRREAYQVARKHNLDGGIAIYHPFRQIEGGAWVRDAHVHYHMIVLAHGDVPPGGTDGTIVFKVIKDAEADDFRGYRNPKAIRRTLHYLLSHAGIIEGRHALTWWGSMSYNRLSNMLLRASYPMAWETIMDYRRSCPVCGSYDVVVVHEWGDRWTNDKGFASLGPLHHHWRARLNGEYR